MRTSQEMIDAIKKFEGYRSNAYRDCGGVWTIGYGHTKGVKEGDKIDKEQAEFLLRGDLAGAEHEANAMPNIFNLSQSQFDAIVDFCYNVGTGAFHRSTLRKKIIANHANPAISKEFIRWRYATIGGVKKEIAGLKRRRAIEAAWYVFGAEWLKRVNDVELWAAT